MRAYHGIASKVGTLKLNGGNICECRGLGAGGRGGSGRFKALLVTMSVAGII